MRSALLEEFDLEIGAGLGALAGKTWRIGLMGFASNERNVLYCLNALEAVLDRQGAAIVTGKALPAAALGTERSGAQQAVSRRLACCHISARHFPTRVAMYAIGRMLCRPAPGRSSMLHRGATSLGIME